MLTYIPVSFLFSFKKGFGLGLKIGLGLGFGFGICNLIGHRTVALSAQLDLRSQDACVRSASARDVICNGLAIHQQEK